MKTADAKLGRGSRRYPRYSNLWIVGEAIQPATSNCARRSEAYPSAHRFLVRSLSIFSLVQNPKWAGAIRLPLSRSGPGDGRWSEFFFRASELRIPVYP
jgi:hypothetical protein